MINISALEPKMSLITNSLKYNDRFKKKKKVVTMPKMT